MLLRKPQEPIEYSKVKDEIEEVLNAPGDKEFRCGKWGEFANKVLGNPIPEYEGENWNASWYELKENEGNIGVEALQGVKICNSIALPRCIEIIL